MEPPQPKLYDPTTDSHLLPAFAALHTTCITHDHTIATFLPPLSATRMESWWQDRGREVSAGSRDIVFLLPPDGGPCDGDAAVVAGVVMLSRPEGETGPFRGLVEKLLVAPEWRGRGFARRLMGALERVAWEGGRWLLMLDTETGSPAEAMYPRLGYSKVGVVPAYGISPNDRTLRSETFFYKDLRLVPAEVDLG